MLRRILIIALSLVMLVFTSDLFRATQRPDMAHDLTKLIIPKTLLIQILAITSVTAAWMLASLAISRTKLWDTLAHLDGAYITPMLFASFAIVFATSASLLCPFTAHIVCVKSPPLWSNAWSCAEFGTTAMQCAQRRGGGPNVSCGLAYGEHSLSGWASN
ncbi:hypothetical protein SeMB42_g07132 [Synchytrium endobioticum]|uniref:Uncharacterized protein n=1 Tax=Synchytrium endobioticum TaxID=286115 RepID=A0A507CE90_9FUNG|nr:hypothetical protein SeMB42_g07132 [Synchytrium endobioticum]TPX43356.1 hypothetical protein SeLEV6574_g05109 [Synchytrium endobioticum]